MQNQKKPIQQKKPMQNFTAEKWADKIALFIDIFGFLSGFFWHWTIALPSPTSHLAMLHSKIILSDPNRRVKVVLHRLFLILKPMQNLGYILGVHWLPLTGQKRNVIVIVVFWEHAVCDHLPYFPDLRLEWRLFAILNVPFHFCTAGILLLWIPSPRAACRVAPPELETSLGTTQKMI